MPQRRDRVSTSIDGCRPGATPGRTDPILLLLHRGFLAALLISAGPAVHAQDIEEPPPLRFEGYAGAPDVSVVPRTDQLFFYPCDQCHAVMEPNPQIRELNVMHNAEMDHGRGRLWCLSCHDLDNRDYLRTFLDEPVEFDQSHIVCGGCHANRHRDWAFGVHGKRVENWQGERTQYNCTHCHDPHSPAIEPRAPSPAPPVRAGLELQQGEAHENVRVWDRHEDQEE